MTEQVMTYQERVNKWWAFTPKDPHEPLGHILLRRERILGPAQDRSVETDDLNETNYLYVLRNSVIGLGHDPELATARLQEVVAHPRLSTERMYQQSFVEMGSKLGPLAVVAYTAFDDSQPEEWVVEGFRGEELAPFAVHTLRMVHSTVWGVDAEDQIALNVAVDEWFPAD